MNRRIRRINELLRQEMSRLIQVDLRDPRLRCVISITRVDTAPDLKAAKVYFSVLASAETRGEVLQGLTAAAGRMVSAITAAPYLVAGADTLHFRRAAEKSHVTQPTLSGQLRELEEKLGRPVLRQLNQRIAIRARLSNSSARRAWTSFTRAAGRPLGARSRRRGERASPS